MQKPERLCPLHVCVCDPFLCSSPAEAEKAIKALNGRYFGGRIVTAEVYDEDKFEANDLTH